MLWYIVYITLQWRPNGRDGVSNHQPLDCLLNHLFRRRSKKTSKLRVTGLCGGNSPVSGEFPAQRASNAENASIWWRHHYLHLNAPFKGIVCWLVHRRILCCCQIITLWFSVSSSLYTVYPKKYAHGFVVLCFVVVMQSFIMNSHEVFIHIHQGCFAGTGAIVRLPQCQWSKPDGYGKISQCITTTKHSKAKTVCIFLGIYCIMYGYVCGFQSATYFYTFHLPKIITVTT